MSFSEALYLEAGERADPGNSHCFLLPSVKVFNIFLEVSSTDPWQRKKITSISVIVKQKFSLAIGGGRALIVPGYLTST